MIKKYNTFIRESMTALKPVSDDEIAEAEEYLEKGKDPNWDYKLGYFYIDVSGKYSVYYTLWRDTPLKSHFITNLSTDFKTAVEKAKNATGRIPVVIDRTGTKAGLFQAAKAEILTFGKHRGKTLGDIFVEDPKYIVWLSNKYSGGNSETFNRILYYKDLYFETVTKKNLEESTSDYFGKIGDKVSLELDIYEVRFNVSDYDGKSQVYCKMIDNKGNKFFTYNIGKSVKKGDTVKLTAKIKDHKLLLGVKFTVLNYCKVTDIFNLQDDMSKYNI
jgi:hypothetical protein